MAVTLTEEDVVAALRSKLGGEDLAVEAWKQVSLMEDGRLGYLGDHFRVEASVRHPAAAPEARHLTLFVKGLPVNARARATVFNSGAFKKESLFYKLLAKDVAAALGGTRGPGFQHFVYPECHLIKDDCMLLEDMGPFKFEGLDARKPMPIEHVRLVVRALAELHAGSLVLEERRGRTIADQFPEIDFETFFSGDPSHSNATWHRASFAVCDAIAPHLDKYKDDPAAVARIQEALPSLLPQLFGALRAWPGVRNVLNHGDVWINNFMFRHDAHGRPVEVTMVDFQLARYTPPASDLVMFVLFCTDRALQEAHMADLTRLHWDSMAAALRRADCDPDKVLPWSEFQDVANKMWKFGLIQMALEYPFSLAPSSIMDPLLVDPDKFHHHCHVDRRATILKLYREDPVFRSRYNEVMERLIDGYILNQS